jgi:hypothetical protein
MATRVRRSSRAAPARAGLHLSAGVYSYQELCAAMRTQLHLSPTIVNNAIAAGRLRIVADVCVDSDGEPYDDLLLRADAPLLLPETGAPDGAPAVTVDPLPSA